MQMSLSVEQICALASMTSPEREVLSRDYTPEKRSVFRHFFRWVFFLITFGRATLNPRLDRQVEKIAHISKNALQSKQTPSSQKLQIVAALKNVVIMSQNNFGKKHPLLLPLIQQQMSLTEETSTTPLQKELARARQIDKIAPTNGWNKGLGKKEREQSLDAFTSHPIPQLHAQRKKLVIPIVGQMPKKEKELLRIVADYLQTVHGIPATIDPHHTKLQKQDQRTRGHQQYALEPQLKILSQKQEKLTFSLGFTNQDLYPASRGDTMNFVMGVAEPYYARGLFSTYRLGNNQNLKLKRLMKLAAHEFGHMRGIDHCTPYACNMQGVNSVDEMDRTPLTFCAQDMAKICHVNHWSLKKGYRRQLRFFQTFAQRHKIEMDFSQEIAHLKEKIHKIG